MTAEPDGRARRYVTARQNMIVRALSSVGADTFPHYAEGTSGQWTHTPNGDWTGSFYVGQLWLIAQANDAADLRDLATRWARLLKTRVGSDTVFRGFLFWYGVAIGADGNAELTQLALAGAHALAGTYNPRAGLIPLGASAEEATNVGNAETNIDTVPATVLLLNWATQTTGDSRFRDIAVRHAAAHARLCVHDDGHVSQSATFDPITGALTRRYTHKGFSDTSTWARAQAWAMLGFTHASQLDPEQFLPIAVRVSDWWISHLPDDHVAIWDFDAPNHPEALKDTSATAIAAAALLKLASLSPLHAERYNVVATDMIDALIHRHLTGDNDPQRRPAGMLLDGCYNHRLKLASASELIWGDYYLLESLHQLTGRLTTTEI